MKMLKLRRMRPAEEGRELRRAASLNERTGENI